MSTTIICAVMNRADMLRVSLMSWLNFSEVSRIVVVDWSSSDLSDDFVRSMCAFDGRIHFERVYGKTLFSLAEAYNLAASLVDTEFLLKLDVDYILNPYYSFFVINKLGVGYFFTGDWRWQALDNDLGFFKYLNGLLYIKTDDFKAVGGYDKRFIGYGYEDTDLCYRLTRDRGLTHRFIDLSVISVYHNPHSDDKRVENYSEKDIRKSLSENCEQYKWQNSLFGRTYKA